MGRIPVSEGAPIVTISSSPSAMTTIFERQAEAYDAWYDSTKGRAIFAAELAAIRPLVDGRPRPWLEVGAGTGRFAEALAIELGLDPAWAALRLARARRVAVVAGIGEQLPFADGAFGLVFFIVTLCFVTDPSAALAEARRVIGRDGAVVIGFVPADGPWGRHYQDQAAAGHLYYREAHFFTRREAALLLAEAGLSLVRTRSSLLWTPTAEPSVPVATEGDDPSAGFVALLAVPS